MQKIVTGLSNTSVGASQTIAILGSSATSNAAVAGRSVKVAGALWQLELWGWLLHCKLKKLGDARDIDLNVTVNLKYCRKSIFSYLLTV
jgi:hypothetical protein